MSRLLGNIQRGKTGKGGCWSAEALLNADKRQTWFLRRELLTAVVSGIPRGEWRSLYDHIIFSSVAMLLIYTYLYIYTFQIIHRTNNIC